MDLDLPRAVLQLLAPRSIRLKSDKEYRVARVGQFLFKVVQNPAAGRHAARGDDHGRTLQAIKPLGFLPAMNHVQVGAAGRALSCRAEYLLSFGVEIHGIGLEQL